MEDNNNNQQDEERVGEKHDTVVDDVNPTQTENTEAENTESEDAKAEDNVAEEAGEELTEEEKLAKENQELKASLEKEKNEYMFLMAEFDNFRKRTLREKSELIKNAGESVFKGLLPIVDDFERALKATEGVDDTASVREGTDLIYKKLKKFLEQNGVKEMDPEDLDFNSDCHEAISAVPVPDESQKGKIIDTVEKGYTINGKVLRYAKVVVGQ